jgi:hypothetical protein
LSSAYAVAIHARPRATKDLDIPVAADPQNAKAVFAALAEFGTPLEGLTSADFAEPGPFFRMGREPVGGGGPARAVAKSRKTCLA